jgi:hypothetical protein
MLLTVLLWLIAAIVVPAGIYAWRRMYRELSHPARWWAWFLASPMLMSIVFFSVMSVTDFGWWTTLSRTVPILLTIVALATPLYV